MSPSKAWATRQKGRLHGKRRSERERDLAEEAAEEQEEEEDQDHYGSADAGDDGGGGAASPRRSQRPEQEKYHKVDPASAALDEES